MKESYSIIKHWRPEAETGLKYLSYGFTFDCARKLLENIRRTRRNLERLNLFKKPKDWQELYSKAHSTYFPFLSVANKRLTSMVLYDIIPFSALS